ncbi:DUF58 domain-containing protein [Blastococcus sp. CCUG 61487]|uniref:DUF58 domain-containing protein n=1 Tax=Blastococcus sp. CCUG 61487 TaxID=1840703 RepID=UPI0010BFCB21|nr:DUF58 domain-containing protein [Blastococcus sp. CCUG 61487]TKJ28654.1 hypothetical protein A6V29_19820 [Blastococcus sp. CCUG 61487]
MAAPGRPRTALTRRGRGLLAAGLTLLAVGALLGEQPMVQLATFVLVLPLLSAFVVSRERFRIAVQRTVTPARVSRGQAAEVVLEVSAADRRATGIWLLTEQLPEALGPAPRFTVTRLATGRGTALRYRVVPARRGRYALGPLRVRVVDPFGLVERSTTGTSGGTLLVVPRVQPLGPTGPTDGRDDGEGARRSIAVHGEDDVSIREYRRGDDLRKVHWRATARTGELKVRLEERPWRARTTILLDTRAPAHLLSRRRDAEVDDSLEWAVEAAAGIAVELTRRGTEVRIVTESGELVGAVGTGGSRSGELLDRLATVAASRRTELGSGLEAVSRGGGDGQVVCLLGALGPGDLIRLARIRQGSTAAFAVLLDLGSWAASVQGQRAGGSAAMTALADQRAEAAAVLRAAGWQVAVARAGDPLPQVWAALAGRPVPSGAGAAS